MEHRRPAVVSGENWRCVVARHHLRTSVLLALVAVAAGPILLPPSVRAAARQKAAFSSRVVGVRVDVLVTERGKPVSGLAGVDFELRDNGVAQTIALLESSDLSLNAVLALDVSASTSGTRLTDLVTASHALLDGLRAGDRAALITFNQAVSPRVPLSTDLGLVRAALGAMAPSGETALMDGVYTALMSAQSQPGRSLVIVYTDGVDTASWLRSDEVLESARRSSAVVYAVVVGGLRRSALKDLTDATGGDLLVVDSSTDLGGAFRRILAGFRSRYVLTFTPVGVAAGGVHRLDVRVRRSGLRVQARPSYIGEPES
jgi:VWFA-related protein